MTQLRGQVSNTIPELGTVSPPAVPNWLQSPLKPRAWLCMEVASNHDNYQLRVNLDKIRDWARSKADGAHDVKSSSNVRIASSRAGIKPTAPLSAFYKENSIVFPLYLLYYIYNYYCGYAPCLLQSSCYLSADFFVTCYDCNLWLHMTVMWYFPMLHLSNNLKEKKKKRNIK